ncbi:MAG: pentapeptide repeat-containing protein [Planctomycetes bacterium]|nr:pentapeptide repeat-containing protein [Planctomycetota bacterium]
MVEDVYTHPELEALDRLIAKLEALITESDESPLVIEPGDPPKRAVYKLLGNAASTATGRKPIACEAILLNDSKLVLKSNKTELVRLTPLEVTVNAEKSGRGEAFSIITGKVSAIRRVRGGYEVDVDIHEKRKNRITPGQRLRECLGKSDAQGWNRWCQDIRDTIELMGIDLKGADLQGYDLCCSDLSGADLTGANLNNAILAGADVSQCVMENVSVAGTDFFRARMNRNQAGLLPLSGMLEVESVVFDS